jgi:SAM-dependent methyltransferase
MNNPAAPPPSRLQRFGMNLAGLPAGALGRFGGAVMYRSNRGHAREVLSTLEVADGARVLEIGPGPGWLLGQLAAGTRAELVAGVDPSAEMLAQAARNNAFAVRTGRIELRAGTAEATGYPDASFDLVISVNNFPMWPDLGRALDELARVLRPGGQLVLAWHSVAAPNPLTRAMSLSGDVLDQVAAAVAERFGPVRRTSLTWVVVLSATR